MDIDPRPAGSEDIETFPWKTIIVYAAIGRFAIETYVSWRQLRVLRRHSQPTLSKDPWNVKSDVENHACSLRQSRFLLWRSFYSTIKIIAFISLDAVPKLWSFVVKEQLKLPRVWISEEFDRSALFLLYCYATFLIMSLPTYLYRTLVLKERVIRNFYSHKNRNWPLHDIAIGRPLPAMLMLTGLFIMEFKVLGIKLGRVYVIGVGVFQVVFCLLYPVLTEPKSKTLSVMEPGRTKDLIEEVAAAASFPLRKVYVIDSQDRQAVQIFGIPKRKYIAIPKNMIEEGNIEEIAGFVAHGMGSWKYSNGSRIFCLGQLFFNHSWYLLTLFLRSRVNYESFGFVNEYPIVAAIIIFTIGMAPFLTVTYSFFIHFGGRKNDFSADKYAVELGYSSNLTNALTTTQTSNSGKGDIDWLFSIYHNPAPAVSERLAMLEKLGEEKGAKEDGLISLSRDEKR